MDLQELQRAPQAQGQDVYFYPHTDSSFSRYFAVTDSYNRIHILVGPGLVYRKQSFITLTDLNLLQVKFFDCTDLVNNSEQNPFRIKLTRPPGFELYCLEDRIVARNMYDFEFQRRQYGQRHKGTIEACNVWERLGIPDSGPKPFEVYEGNKKSYGTRSFNLTNFITGEVIYQPINLLERDLPERDPSITFDQAIEEQITRLRSNASRKILMWSGGIDSTCAYYILKKYGIDFTVIMNDNSALEYPRLSHEIRENCHTLSPSVLRSEEFLSKSKDLQLILGEPAGQLFSGGELCKRFFMNKNRGAAHYKDVFPEVQWKHAEWGAGQIIDLENASARAFAFAQSMFYKYLFCVTRGPAKFQPYEIFNMFESTKMQQVGLNNFEYECEIPDADDCTDRKKLLREYIYSCNGDEDYYRHKVKIGSLIAVTTKKFT